jgi:hypothetical protein
VLSSITALDVASARGRHAAWLGATTPPRFLSPEEAAAGGPVQLPRAWHPLLLQPCLPALPTPPLSEDELQQLGASQQQDAAEAQRCGAVRQLPRMLAAQAHAMWRLSNFDTLASLH